MARSADAERRAFGWQLAIVLGVSAVFEALFLRHGLNHLDETWPLYAAMQMQAGGVLYDEVLWVFPPAHLWMAQLAYWMDPPGVTAARALYALWNVALCGFALVLARRLMPARFAFFAALLIAIAAPRTHLMQALYGYRYLVLTVLALLCFDRRLRTGDWRWMLGAGALAGTALLFRLTPPFAVSCGIGLGILCASRDWRIWLRDGSAYAAALIAVLVPALAWFHASVGIGTLGYEVVLHPLGMLQDLPWPELRWPADWSRTSIRLSFVAFQFRIYWLLYAAYGVVLLWRWVDALRTGKKFDQSLCVAVVVWGAVFFIRSLGRSDEPHVDSVLPPICLLLAHALSVVHRRWAERRVAGARSALRQWTLIAIALVAWVFVTETDVAVSSEFRGQYPVAFRGETVWVPSAVRAKMINEMMLNIEKLTRPGDTILDLSASPLFYVATERFGPGYSDIVMPGTFATAAQEEAFVARLEAQPPAVVIASPYAFDRMPERAMTAIAPRVQAWVEEGYEQFGPTRRWILMRPKRD